MLPRRTVPSRRHRLRRDLRTIFSEGVSFSVMVGIGESYLAAFVLALGMGEVAAGLVTTVPLLAGGLIQLVTPIGVRRMGSRRRWSVACAALQSASFLPLIGGAWIGQAAGWLVFAAASLYWAAGMAVGPAWNAWVERLVPRPARTGYFARRTSAVQLGTLLGFVVGGLVLDRVAPAGRPLAGFVVLFGVAWCARTLSTALLASQSERLDEIPPEEGGLPALSVMRRGPKSPAARFLLYLLLLTGSVAIASPYFSPYMLAELELSYVGYMALVGSSLTAKVLALPLLAGFAKRVGLVALLRVAWLGIALVPGLWLVSSRFEYLLALQILSGVCWAMHEYVAFLLLFETIHASRRVGILTAYNFGHACALVGGSLLGGWIFRTVGSGADGYAAIFAISGVARLGCLAVLARVRGTGAGGLAIPIRELLFRPVAVRPAAGAFLRPLLASVRRRSDDAPAESDEPGAGGSSAG